jgi:tetratricopeptide (TPR) repeat protein
MENVVYFLYHTAGRSGPRRVGGKMKKSAKKHGRSNKVVRLRTDAGFFFERAVRSLDRHNYDKALKYFRIAAEKEPDNPINLCNLAGILSEVGRFEESNEVLETVLNNVDPHLYECYFYMANNAANMEDFDLAEEYLLRYLEEDPEGEFAEEANEMLQMLAYELGRAPRQPDYGGKYAWMKKHDEARRHLEEGHFLQATRALEELVAEYPDFLAARNNLSLAYYYTGQLNRALQEIEKVLEADPANLHALCNLAVLYQHMGETAKKERLVASLKKWVPFHLEHMYKLGTTMGILGEHVTAYQLFRRLLKMEPQPEPSLYHYTAAAAFNTGRLAEAEKYWKRALEADPDSDVPRFYLNQLKEWRTQGETRLQTVSYHYQLPFEWQFRQLAPQGRAAAEQIKRNPLIRSSFFWALNHGDLETKLQVIKLFGWIADAEVEQVLRQFVMKPEEDDELKKMALLVLSHMGAEEPYRARIGGKEVEVRSSSGDRGLPSWVEQWKRVLECCLDGMRGRYDAVQIKDAQTLWAQYLSHCKAAPPRVRKVEGWAAALEYVVAKMHGLCFTQADAARKYQVAAATVGRHARELERVCDLTFREPENP